MTALQKAWVRIAGVMILAVAVGVYSGVISLPFADERTAQDKNVVMQGSSADLFCEGVFKTLLRENAAERLQTDRARIDAQADGFTKRVHASVTMEEITEAEREALFAGRLRTVAALAALDRAKERDQAKSNLTAWISQCDARLAKLGVPPDPEGPEPGSAAWYMQNR